MSQIFRAGPACVDVFATLRQDRPGAERLPSFFFCPVAVQRKNIPPGWVQMPSSTTTSTFKYFNFISTFGVRTLFRFRVSCEVLVGE